MIHQNGSADLSSSLALVKSDKLWISWSTVGAYIVPCESALHVSASCFVKADLISSHDALNLALAGVVESLPRVTAINVATKAERVGRETGFLVVSE